MSGKKRISDDFDVDEVEELAGDLDDQYIQRRKKKEKTMEEVEEETRPVVKISKKEMEKLNEKVFERAGHIELEKETTPPKRKEHVDFDMGEYEYEENFVPDVEEKKKKEFKKVDSATLKAVSDDLFGRTSHKDKNFSYSAKKAGDHYEDSYDDYIEEDGYPDDSISVTEKHSSKKKQRKQEYFDDFDESDEYIDDTSKRHSNKKKVKVKNYFLFYFLIFLVIMILIIGLYFILVPQIHLKGKKKIILNYQDVYKEPGYSLNYFGQDKTNDIVVKGKVNSKVLGVYEIHYNTKNGTFLSKRTRKVKVSDIEKPKINISKDDIVICPGKKYEKEKVEVIDNYDGDLSSKLTIEDKEDSVTYTVSDTHKNKTTITRKLIYDDKTPPVLTLNGNQEEKLYVGGTFTDDGATASDNCDGDLTSSISVDNPVNVSKVGEYQIQYTVSDKKGNKSELVRKVVVLEKPALGTVYLTFDDGPNEGTTNVILDILKEEGVKATFFVTSRGPDDLIKREHDEGHTVAIHTSSHDYAKIYSSDEAFWADMQTVSDRIERLTGVKTKYMRFPGGASNTVSRKYSSGIMSRLTEQALQKGYKYYDWNISSGDAGETTDPNKIYSNVVGSLRRDRVNMVLMHDIKTYTRDALRNIIQYCKANNYQMEAITDSTPMVTQKVNN